VATTTLTVDRTVLVEADWLAEHLFDPAVRVVEVDVSPAAFQDWHIEGATLWNIYTDLKDPNFRPVEPAALAALLARSGITPDSTVVFYGYGPTLGFWLMTLYGHADVRILDCSRESWRSADHPWTTSATAAHPSSGDYELGTQDADLRADLDDVRAAPEPGGRPWPCDSTPDAPTSNYIRHQETARPVAAVRRTSFSGLRSTEVVRVLACGALTKGRSSS
jgi:3-mercaptopyruvate sulfurtransferase SseA